MVTFRDVSTHHGVSNTWLGHSEVKESQAKTKALRIHTVVDGGRVLENSSSAPPASQSWNLRTKKWRRRRFLPWGNKGRYFDHNQIQPATTSLSSSRNSKLPANVLEFSTNLTQVFGCEGASSYTRRICFYDTYGGQYRPREMIDIRTDYRRYFCWI